MKGGTKLSKVMARTLSPGITAAQDRHMLDTTKASAGDNSLLSPAGTDQAHAPTIDEWLEMGDPETLLTPHSGGSDGQSGGKRRRRRRRTGGKKHSRKTKSKGKKTRSKSKKRRGGKRRTQRR